MYRSYVARDITQDEWFAILFGKNEIWKNSRLCVQICSPNENSVCRIDEKCAVVCLVPVRFLIRVPAYMVAFSMLVWVSTIVDWTGAGAMCKMTAVATSRVKHRTFIVSCSMECSGAGSIHNVMVGCGSFGYRGRAHVSARAKNDTPVSETGFFPILFYVQRPIRKAFVNVVVARKKKKIYFP